MNTIIALTIFIVLLYGTFMSVVFIWGYYEIDPEDYERMAWTFKEYPDLGIHLKTFRHNGRITVAELRKIDGIRRRRVRDTVTEEEIKAHRQLIITYIED